MARTITTRELMVCDWCACMIANGEVGDDEDTARQLALMIAKLGDDLAHVVVAGEDDDYSSRACDGCGGEPGAPVNLHRSAILRDVPDELADLARLVSEHNPRTLSPYGWDVLSRALQCAGSDESVMREVRAVLHQVREYLSA